MDWRDLSPEQMEYEFNPQKSVEDFSSCQVERTAISERARRGMKADLDVYYGTGATQTVDVFPAEPAADGAPPPLHVFFHGGYWRAQDKVNFAFVAETLVGQGITTVVANYDLCPATTLDGSISSALAAVAWSFRNAGRYGADPGRLTLSGNSAGAHIVAMALACDWTAEGLPGDLVKGAVPISGIFDPEPAMHISVNGDIRLTDDIVRRNNALALPARHPVPVHLFVGGLEPPHWQGQSRDYAGHLERHGFEPTVTIVPGKHHFNIMDQYLDAAEPIVQAILAVA